MKTGSASQPFLAAFDKKVEGDDDEGNYRFEFAEQFQERAAYIYERGTETVIASRLQGRDVLKVRVRNNANTRQITSDWQMRDVERGAVLAVRSVDDLTDRGWIWLQVERGVAP